MRSSKYTRELLAPLVASSRSVTEVIAKLGLANNGGNFRHISARIRLAELDTSHFAYGKSSCVRVPREQLVAIVEACTSVAQVAARLGLATEGRPHRNLSRLIKELEIDTTHFKGPGWSRGETKDTHPSVRDVWRKTRLADDTVFVENGLPLGGRSLVRRLIAMGWPYCCAWCGISEWRGIRLVLHLDHINGINNDNRLINLRMLCPNCHSQTATYCNRRR